MSLRCGAIVAVRWEPGEDWQRRVVLNPATRDEFVEIMGELPRPEPPDLDKQIWWCLSPDLDH